MLPPADPNPPVGLPPPAGKRGVLNLPPIPPLAIDSPRLSDRLRNSSHRPLSHVSLLFEASSSSLDDADLRPTGSASSVFRRHLSVRAGGPVIGVSLRSNLTKVQRRDRVDNSTVLEQNRTRHVTGGTRPRLENSQLRDATNSAVLVDTNSTSDRRGVAVSVSFDGTNSMLHLRADSHQATTDITRRSDLDRNIRNSTDTVSETDYQRRSSVLRRKRNSTDNARISQVEGNFAITINNPRN
ncbi:uncharacterized protein LOC119103973 [Pollicipes pollicipes]|uniref:uncharacterized protein LOC119103973 n=1 Tax=Pollicipes pollicipes TaxID=41117 RepID=UPI001884D2B8|nr:uncharacterized protein LOC119103973 [Pollicipes pollicipes]